MLELFHQRKGQQNIYSSEVTGEQESQVVRGAEGKGLFSPVGLSSCKSGYYTVL
jgi:hypothetical protein